MQDIDRDLPLSTLVDWNHERNIKHCTWFLYINKKEITMEWWRNYKCKRGIHQRETIYKFTYYEDPIKEKFPHLIAHYDVTCPNCNKTWKELRAFPYDNTILSHYSKTIEDAKTSARKYLGDWHYIDIELPIKEKANIERMKKENI